ncbi:carcinoembryonic antigen-related cell adhesion molecule 21-like isoform X2 [Bubalus kerabau]|uniref:carcinoembryonic antigen-related cell adhesion molecule 21-like isoform X2 n=2 Tax=Bubalus TaxID=9918 RepID=UPI00244E8CA6|nr:carcinoembryonic antigen-related cell adhesion molecule 21-like isoform X2 [Bubalus carabanensis]
MEPPSGPASRRHVPWNRLLPAVSLLSFWTLPTTARLTVDTVPPLAAEGSVAVFNILEKEGLIIGYGWFRGNRVDQRAAIEAYQIINNSHTPGPSHTGRETIKPNGSLVIQSVKKQDAGTYTVITVKADLTNVSASGQLQVYSLLQRPSIQVSDPMVREKENKVVMTCITNEMDISVKWIFNKQQLKSAKNVFLSKDGKNLTIDPIKKENAGDYQCEISNIGTSNRSETFELKVKDSGSKLTTGTIATIIIGILVALAVTVALMYFLFSNKL